MTPSQRLPVEQIRETLKRARSALPEGVLAHDTEAADHPDSIYTLETYRLALDGSEFELALCALAGVARAAKAATACWTSLADAARLIGPESEQRLRAIRGGA